MIFIHRQGIRKGGHRFHGWLYLFFDHVCVTNLTIGEKRFNIDFYDPIADLENSLRYYDIKFIKKLKKKFYDAIIITVAHDIFFKMGIKNIKKLVKSNNIIFDVKGLFNKKDIDLTL